MFHAIMLVTRAEEWCVEAETAEEAHGCSPRATGTDVTWAIASTSKCIA
jgi:hypothetical protein